METPKFSVIVSDGSIQVRNYEEMVSAEIKTNGDRYSGLRAGFIPLARYIGAKERSGEKISMTAPVMQQVDKKNKVWKISFFMPSKYSLDQLPPTIQNEILLYLNRIFINYLSIIINFYLFKSEKFTLFTK